MRKNARCLILHYVRSGIVFSAANLLDTLHRVVGSANLAYDTVIFLDFYACDNTVPIQITAEIKKLSKHQLNSPCLLLHTTSASSL